MVALVVATTIENVEAQPVLVGLNGCDIMVIDETPIDGFYYICITDKRDIGLHRVNENIDCQKRVEIVYNQVMDLSSYINDCEFATPTKTLLPFSTIKSLYR